MVDSPGSGTRPRWRILRDGIKDPFLHFALEEAILRGVDEGTSPETLRLRQVDPSVFIGIYQDPEDEVHLPYCETNGIRIVRRQNPGGAVYQDTGSFCFSATFRRTQFERWGILDVSRLYEKVGRAVVGTCADFGAVARARPVNDVEIDGRKVYGSAQIAWYDSFVHSGTFLVSTDIDAMARALRPSMLKFADKGGSGIRSRVVNLSEAVGRNLDLSEVMLTLATHLAREFDVDLVAQNLSHGELVTARQLLESKYGRKEWTFRNKESHSTVVSIKARSGVVTVEANVRGAVLESLRIRGDFILADQAKLESLMNQLRGTPVQEAPGTVSRCEGLPEDVREAICGLLEEIGRSSSKEGRNGERTSPPKDADGSLGG
jgi:lipoate---protein ligase